jgi:hypothetical protein
MQPVKRDERNYFHEALRRHIKELYFIAGKLLVRKNKLLWFVMLLLINALPRQKTSSAIPSDNKGTKGVIKDKNGNESRNLAMMIMMK